VRPTSEQGRPADDRSSSSTTLINGALLGLLYSLVAMGFVVIYRASKVFNIAQGELVVFGGFLVWWLLVQLGLPLWSGMPLAFWRSAVFGLLIERMLLLAPGRRVGVLDGHGDHRPADPDPRPGAAAVRPAGAPLPDHLSAAPIIIGD
jgi:hypothetical protein